MDSDSEDDTASASEFQSPETPPRPAVRRRVGRPRYSVSDASNTIYSDLGNSRIDLEVADANNTRKRSTRENSEVKETKGKKNGDSPVSPFKTSMTITEIAHKSPIYAVAFNPYQPDSSPIFATAARNMIHIYTLDPHSKNFTLVRTIVDDNRSESFFALTWCFDSVVKKHRLVAAGHCANIKVLDPDEGKLCEEFIGHGDIVNELRTDHNNSMVFASVSKDTTVRVWNIRVNVGLIIFGGQEGHNDQVLSCDWSPDSDFVISCGMDHSIRMWHLNDDCRRIIAHSMTPDGEKEIRARSPISPQLVACVQVQFPNAWTTDLHCDYVDCVRYLNWVVVSKGSEKTANIFRFGHVDDAVDHVFATKVPSIRTEKRIYKADTACTLIHQLNLPACDVWFLKFDIDPNGRWLVFGSKDGKLYFFDLHALTSDADYHTINFTLTVSSRAVRQVCFDKTGDVIIAVTDAHQVIRLDRVKDDQQPFVAPEAAQPADAV